MNYNLMEIADFLLYDSNKYYLLNWGCIGRGKKFQIINGEVLALKIKNYKYKKGYRIYIKLNELDLLDISLIKKNEYDIEVIKFINNINIVDLIDSIDKLIN